MQNGLAPSISLGICLPYDCSADQLESAANGVIHAKLSDDMMVVIPENFCQFEPRISDWRPIDLAAM